MPRLARPLTVTAGAALLLAAGMLAPAAAHAEPPTGPGLCSEDVWMSDNGQYPHESSPNYYWYCLGVDGDVTLYKCKPGLEYNSRINVCDYPPTPTWEQTGADPYITAKPARLRILPLQVTGLSATIYPGKAGELVTFSALGGGTLCTATATTVPGTKDVATATCDSPIGLTNIGATVDSLLRGYKVTIDKDRRTATGTIGLL